MFKAVQPTPLTLKNDGLKEGGASETHLVHGHHYCLEYCCQRAPGISCPVEPRSGPHCRLHTEQPPHFMPPTWYSSSLPCMEHGGLSKNLRSPYQHPDPITPFESVSLMSRRRHGSATNSPPTLTSLGIIHVTRVHPHMTGLDTCGWVRS